MSLGLLQFILALYIYIKVIYFYKHNIILMCIYKHNIPYITIFSCSSNTFFYNYPHDDQYRRYKPVADT